MFRPVSTCAGIAALVGAVVAVPSGASAQGLFDFLFRGLLRSAPQAGAYAPVEPEIRPVRRRSVARGGSRTAFCVRLCDGRYFPIQPIRNVSEAELCQNFCPAAESGLFRGRSIGAATDENGTRYIDLDHAFIYRERLVAGCTCNGNNPFGLARFPVDRDPTLRKGDIVATQTGFMAYNGKPQHMQEAYTPIDDARVAKSLRRRLADIDIRANGPSWYRAIAVPLPRPRPVHLEPAHADLKDDAQSG